MTDAEVRFLKKLIHAKLNAGDDSSAEWIEVGHFVGISMRTVETFCGHNLIETEGRNNTQTWARLKSDPYDTN